MTKAELVKDLRGRLVSRGVYDRSEVEMMPDQAVISTYADLLADRELSPDEVPAYRDCSSLEAWIKRCQSLRREA